MCVLYNITLIIDCKFVINLGETDVIQIILGIFNITYENKGDQKMGFGCTN